MKHVTRRSFMSGTANVALIGAVARPAIALCTDHTSELQQRMRDLEVCAKRFRELDRGAIVDQRSLRAWQTSYDCLCAAADGVRYSITDETTGRDAAIEFARSHVWPSCDRAILYWQPLSDLSRSYAPFANAFFSARERLARHYAAWPRLQGSFEHAGKDLIEASRNTREAIPITRDDRRAARRMIDSINNDDMVDVSIVRSTLEEHEVGDFRHWARLCGSFSCASCNAWLGDTEEET